MSISYDIISKMSKKQILCCPGPVQLHSSVKKALADTQICHRDIAFEQMQEQAAANIRTIAHTDEQLHKIVFVTGSGTSANETAIVAFGKLGRLLMISNGEFGERLIKLARLHHEKIDQLSVEWGQPISLKKIRHALRTNTYAGVVVVHHETSTGILNPIAEIAAIAHEYKAFIYVDAVSSLGAEEFEAAKWGIDSFSTSSGKALASIPGIGIIGISKELANRIASLPKTVQYLDLATYITYADQHSQTPNTPSVHALAALEAATDRICHMGPDRYRAVIHQRASYVRSELTKMGLSYFDYGDATSSVITCVKPGNTLNIADLLAYMRKNHIVLYGGKGELEGNIFQIGHIGELSPRTVRYVLRKLRAYLSMQHYMENTYKNVETVRKSRGLHHVA